MASQAVSQSAAQWFYSIGEGYSHRVPCYSYLRHEENATAFFYKDGDFLIFIDMGRKERQAIRVVPKLNKTTLKLLKKINNKITGA